MGMQANKPNEQCCNVLSMFKPSSIPT